MRYKDLLEQKNLRPGIKNTLPPTFVMPTLQNNDIYKQYRHTVALASARAYSAGETVTDKESPWGENQAVICYTKEDEETLKLANKIMGVTSKPLTSSQSHESPLVNKTSPVRKFVDLSESFANDEDHSHGTIVRTILDSNVANELYDWCKERKIDCILPEKMHCTLLYSSNPVPHISELNGYKLHANATVKEWKKLGTALVLILDCPVYHVVHNFIKKKGGTHDYDHYLPHLTINYNWQKSLPEELPNITLVFHKIDVMGIDPNYIAKTKKP